MHLLSQLFILPLLMKPLCETSTLFLCLFFHLLVQCHYYLFLYDYNDSSMRTSVLPFSSSAAPTLLGLGRLLLLPSVFLEAFFFQPGEDAPRIPAVPTSLYLG